ncbi:hypothetical protein AQUCO_00400367v1 [Aquilegia coerulea]|uniref:Clp R domain-containing protein n=1 Tax=Aquilegia coerulea TaxID=218851 RepID=A0A2G5EUQ4_AQUCA|nr:hypothetical protein AQUCO_00400367v1 [Aquilegia coerulea]
MKRMPTSVSIARQCLTQEASHALDEAVSVARRRSHSQTTSLHLISAFLSLPSSSLRDACSRVTSSSYAPRFQFKALELCFASALDRLPSTTQTQTKDVFDLVEPPISNSLMAAIKRSQANQRRNPETFHLYQQQQQQQSSSSSSSLNCVKVELQQLILSILDDPIVSRVFAEAGFRSCDIKLAVLRPLPPLGRFHRSRRAPLFLCNLPGGDSEELGNNKNFNFPFLGCSGFGEFNHGEENFRRIGEVLSRNKERNPLLVGVCACDALRVFSEILDRGKVGLLPVEISGLSFFCIEKEISKFISDKSGNEGLCLNSKFVELGELIEKCCGPGVVVSFGDLKVLLDDNSVDTVSYLVSQLSGLLEVHRGKLWLMGAAASYEMYLKFLMRFPSIEKDWDLQLLPITSLKSPVGGVQSRPQSLMESFVPFGGFFSASDLKAPLISSYQPISRCHLCNEKYEQEVSAFLNGGCTPSVADQYHASLPSWLQKGDLHVNKGLDVAKATDDGTVFNAKVTGLQNKWNDICRRLHHCPAISKTDDCRVRPPVVPGTMGFSVHSDREDNGSNLRSSMGLNALSNKNDCGNAQPPMSIGLHKVSLQPQKCSKNVVSEAKDESLAHELHIRTSKTECLQRVRLCIPPYPLSSSSIPDEHASPSSAASVTTDLGLGTLYASSYKEPKELTVQAHKEWPQTSPDYSPATVNVVKQLSNPSIQSSLGCGADFSGQVDPNDLKSLWRYLMDKVGRQKEAIHAISETIARCRTGHGRRRGASLKRDVWFSFIGLDRVAKRRTALALAEILFGSKQNVISVDLSSQDGTTHTNTIFGCQEINGYDVKFRGKMVVDYIAEEISKKPLSVVFLENINKADVLLQNSLSQAIKTGKFSDSRGREIGINNTTFIATSSVIKDAKTLSSEKICQKFSEERILRVQCLEMQILVGCLQEDNAKINHTNVSVKWKKETPDSSFVNKRKVRESSDTIERCETYERLERAHKTPKYLDLNLPVEETEADDLDCDNIESDTVSENSEIWLEEFLAQMDGTAMFQPFDFDALANRLLKEISAVFRNKIGSECALEIDSKVMEQIVAASWLSENTKAVDDWMEQILGWSFTEARQRYALTCPSVLKLVPCDNLYVKDQAAGVALPCRIMLN